MRRKGDKIKMVSNCFNCKHGDPLLTGKVRCPIQNDIMEPYDGCNAFKFREEFFDDDESSE